MYQYKMKIFHFDKSYTTKQCAQDINNHPNECLDGLLMLQPENSIAHGVLNKHVICSLCKLIARKPLSMRAHYYQKLVPFIKEQELLRPEWIILHWVMEQNKPHRWSNPPPPYSKKNAEESMWLMLETRESEWGRLRLSQVMQILELLKHPVSEDITQHPNWRYVMIAAVMYDRYVTRVKNNEWHEGQLSVDDRVVLQYALYSDAGYSADMNMYSILFDVEQYEKEVLRPATEITLMV